MHKQRCHEKLLRGLENRQQGKGRGSTDSIVGKGCMRRESGVLVYSNPQVENISSSDSEGAPAENRTTLADITNEGQGQHQPQSQQCINKAKKGKRNSFWSDEQMSSALLEHESGASMRQAATVHGIPYSTFREWCNGVRKSRKRGGTTVLTLQEEDQLVQYLLAMSDRGFGLSSIDLRMKVFEMTKNRCTPFRNGIPGNGWLRWFKHRHPELSFWVAQGLPSARAKALCSENVQSFYDNLSKLYTALGYSPERVWNCDETGVQAGRSGGAIVIGRRGVRHVHLTIPDQREWLSILVCINAAGFATPSFYIF